MFTNQKLYGIDEASDYKIYLIKDGCTYKPDGHNLWEKLDIPLEKVFSLYHGKKTWMLTWQDHCLLSRVFVSEDDKALISESLTDHVFKKVLTRLSEFMKS